MLSEGRPGVDNLYSLVAGEFPTYFVAVSQQHCYKTYLHGRSVAYLNIQGILRLELDKATYERCGLQGAAIPDKGRKHVKSRFGKRKHVPFLKKGGCFGLTSEVSCHSREFELDGAVDETWQERL